MNSKNEKHFSKGLDTQVCELLQALTEADLIASNFTSRWTHSQVIFNSVLSPSPPPHCTPNAPPMYWLKSPPPPSPHPDQILKRPPSKKKDVLNTCGKPWKVHISSNYTLIISFMSAPIKVRLAYMPHALWVAAHLHSKVHSLFTV